MRHLVVRRCGHKEMVFLASHRRDLEGALAAEAQKYCSSCWNFKQQEEERALGLPELEGPHYLVGYASKVRWCLAEEADKYLRSNGLSLKDAMAAGSPEGDAQRLREIFLNKSAEWWLWSGRKSVRGVTLQKWAQLGGFIIFF